MTVQTLALEPTPSAGLAAEALQSAMVDDIENYGSAPGLFTNVQGRPISVDTAIADLQGFARDKPTLADLTLPLPAKLSNVVNCVRRYGVAILPGLISGDSLKALSSEFEAIAGNPDEMAKMFSVDSNDENVCVRVQRAKLQNGLAPDLASFYASPILAAFASHYFGHDDFILNHQIFVHRTMPTQRPLSGDLHFDVSRMLKFWIYLDEGKADAGAIRMAPGTNILLGKVREEFSERLIPKKEIFNEVDETRHPPLSIDAPAGSLVIFDTDTAHGAGHVAPGNVRRIIRGHTVETKYVDRAKKRANG